MAKAFDSVGLTSLRHALARIKISVRTINFIIDLFEERQISIITAYRLTNFITGKDGIDQGETIFSLLWRIFYDPLLCQIQNSQRGYIMNNLNMSSNAIFDHNAEHFRLVASAF